MTNHSISWLATSGTSRHRTIRPEHQNYGEVDYKSGRDGQADDAERRRRKRDIAEEPEREDETESPVEAGELTDLVSALEPLEFPATGIEVVAVVGDRGSPHYE